MGRGKEDGDASEAEVSCFEEVVLCMLGYT